MSIGALWKKQYNMIPYKKKINCGNLEFIFGKARRQGDNPVVIHAKFTGLS